MDKQPCEPFPFEAKICFTYRCNLACPYCYERFERESGNGSELPLPVWINFFDELAALGVIRIALVGGEVLCHPYFPEMLSWLAAHNIRFHMISNGTLLTREMAEQIANTRRCDYVTVSLDGFEDYHDSIRGQGMFQKSLNAINLLHEAGIPVKVNSVIARENCRDALPFAHFLETLPLDSYRFILRSDDFYGNCGDPAALAVEELATLITDFVPHVSELRLLKPGSPPLGFLHKIRHPRPNEETCAFCRSPFLTLGVSPDGAVTPCPEALEPVAGYIGRDSLTELWNGPVFQSFRARVKAGEKRDKPECADCPYLFYCRKSCPLSRSEAYCLRKLATLLQASGVDV